MWILTQPTRPGHSFNGAGMFPSQKCGGSLWDGQPRPELQWGRDVSIPEMSCAYHTGRRDHGFNGAGMFPSQKWRRGRDSGGDGTCFNGAGMFPSQKFARLAPVPPDTELQWGRDVSIPEIGQGTKVMAWAFELQWGRDVSIPEMFCRRILA